MKTTSSTSNKQKRCEGGSPYYLRFESLWREHKITQNTLWIKKSWTISGPFAHTSKALQSSGYNLMLNCKKACRYPWWFCYIYCSGILSRNRWRIQWYQYQLCSGQISKIHQENVLTSGGTWAASIINFFERWKVWHFEQFTSLLLEQELKDLFKLQQGRG